MDHARCGVVHDSKMPLSAKRSADLTKTTLCAVTRNQVSRKFLHQHLDKRIPRQHQKSPEDDAKTELPTSCENQIKILVQMRQTQFIEWWRCSLRQLRRDRAL